MTRAQPVNIDWWIWRVVTSQRVHVELKDFTTIYDVNDVFDFHEALDLLAAVDAELNPPRAR